MPRLSVLMPVYQADQFLKASIVSILNQTYSDFELLILCDDMSETTKKILECFSGRDSRIKIHYLGGIGLVGSLNYGLQISQGEFIARMDADDLSNRKRFEIQVQFMDDNPDIGLCGSWVRSFGKFPSKIWRYPTNNSELQCRLFFGSFFAHPTVIIRKKVLEENNLLYDPNCKFAEDYDLWTRICKFSKIANIPQVLLLYRINPGSIQVKFEDIQENSLKYIYTRNLQELGIEVNDQEIELHKEILKHCVWLLNMKNLALKERNFIIRSHSWLQQIHDANLKTNHYNQKIFTQLLSELFFNICYHHGTPGFFGWKQFINSPLTRFAGFNFKKRSFFLLKYLIKFFIPKRIFCVLPEI